MIQIKHRFTDEVILDVNAESLRGTNLSRTNLRHSDLRYSNLRDTNLSHSDLSYSDLRGTDLSGAKGIMQWQAPQGEKRICYSVKHDDCVMHKLGCFWGNTDEAIKAIKEKYGNNSMYEQLLTLNAKTLECEE